VTPLRRHRARWRVWLFGILGSAWLWLPHAADAHKPSDSYLSITQSDSGALSGRWDIALRDLDFAIGLDADGDGAITWGEVRAKHADIAAYALARLALRGDDQPCSVQVGAQMLDDHTDGTYSVLPLTTVGTENFIAGPGLSQLGFCWEL